ncbi:MAG: histidine phosphatase family protein [Cyanobacteria bacterium J06614_10]
MKKLHLIRHAKSSWNNSNLADIDRPLNQRGLRACQVMAPQIVKAGCSFDTVFCSPAVRAQSTIEEINQALSDQTITWQTDNQLYTFEARDLLSWCQALDEALDDVVVVGHNSAITEFVNWVGDRPLENVPTCGYVQLKLPTERWQDLSENSAELVTFLKPKMFAQA